MSTPPSWLVILCFLLPACGMNRASQDAAWEHRFESRYDMPASAAPEPVAAPAPVESEDGLRRRWKSLMSTW